MFKSNNKQRNISCVFGQQSSAKRDFDCDSIWTTHFLLHGVCSLMVACVCWAYTCPPMCTLLLWKVCFHRCLWWFAYCEGHIKRSFLTRFSYLSNHLLPRAPYGIIQYGSPLICSGVPFHPSSICILKIRLNLLILQCMLHFCTINHSHKWQNELFRWGIFKELRQPKIGFVKWSFFIRIHVNLVS